MDNYHLTPDGENWILTKEGSDRAIGKFPTKSAALSNAAYLVGEREGSLKIHRADGTIEEERTYPRSLDPAKSPG